MNWSSGRDILHLFGETFHPAAAAAFVALTTVGPGKLEEIAAYCREHEIDVVIFDDELTPSQTRNIEKEMPCRLLDHARV